MIFREVPPIAKAGAVLAAGAATGGAFALRQIYKNLTGDDDHKRQAELRLQRFKPFSLWFRPLQHVVEKIADGSLPKADFDSRAMALELLLIHRPDRFFEIALKIINAPVHLKDISNKALLEHIQANQYDKLSEAFEKVKTYNESESKTKESRQTTIQELKAIALKLDLGS